MTSTKRTYRVTGSTPDGQSETRTVEAVDEWKARTTFMAFTTLRPMGQTVSYEVVEVDG